ncbi:hypothetical protein ASPWEDRAFT_27743 [Aspergillus wentii DTO 134E9]|uniref:Uncharacterized protein n=1 Tax=Aspergillus wentii DTO 134E9 TaxID=1073089 RepID=A0A1L9RJF7_ASPWE|nr:uncharacterized protein ASPWEDRAFT_27743 [Aspergillus wentii DTO 134E9]KAI9931974.1 hypothetical protein MW887_009475 [Aspergillus wentii]OJJ35069.1 hypothetical protein ASPWEDRAFT_27743 [Aspergillus wentii DTO 134E9]
MAPIPIPTFLSSPPVWITAPLHLRTEPQTQHQQSSHQFATVNSTTSPLHSRSHPDPDTNIYSIPSSYGRLNDGPSPGTVAGIILGSVAGFIFLLYLLFLAISSGRNRSGVVGEEERVEVRRTPSSRRRRGGGSGSGGSRRTPGNSDIVEVFEEQSQSSRSRPRSRHDHVVVEESVMSRSRTDDDDVVEVEEEHSSVGRPPPRRHRRGSYRSVDPYEYGSSIDGSRY